MVRRTNKKIQRYVDHFPNEFQATTAYLWCSLCHVKVDCGRKSQVDAHRNSAKHKQHLLPSSSSNISLATSSTDTINEENFPRRVTEAFLAADIPLKKLQNPKIKQLFNSLEYSLPSESACRKKVDEIASDVKEKIKNVIENEEITGIFVVFDETTIRDNSYACVLVGTVDDPTTTYLAHTEILESALTAQKAGGIVDDVLRRYQVPKQKVLLLLSDAARYMVKAGQTLKFFYANMIHVTCISHLLHNAAMKVKSSFSKVYKVVATVKAATVKNNHRKGLFLAAGL